uniref:Uncharacterized protein n=1 Tax=Ditylenchus dipsaci TaxID=166011 RepID=A0A915DVG7_9BILA
MSKACSTLYSNYLVFIALLVLVKLKVNPSTFLGLTIVFVEDVLAQINLGTFGLKKNPRGELELGFGQGVSLFGFGVESEI